MPNIFRTPHLFRSPLLKMNCDEKAAFELRLLLSTVEITVAAHDTTGGMVTKISEAAMIAKLGIDVYIVKVINQSLFLYFFFSNPFIFLIIIIINLGSDRALSKGSKRKTPRKHTRGLGWDTHPPRQIEHTHTCMIHKHLQLLFI